MKKIIFVITLFFSREVSAQWQYHYLPDTIAVKKLTFLNDSVGFAACYWDDGSPGAIYKTTDGATTWVKTQFPNSIYDVEFISEDTGFAVGIYGRVYRTIDQGDSWQLLNTLSPWWKLNCIYFKNEHESYIGASEDYCMTCTEVLIKSTDLWQNYSPVVLPDSGIMDPMSQIVDIKFINPDTGFAVSIDNLWRTTDGGNNWEFNFQLGNSYTYFESIFQNPVSNNLFLVGRANVDATNPWGQIYQSDNYGNWWNEQQGTPLNLGIDTIAIIFDGHFVTGNIGYAVGGNKPAPTANPDAGIARTTDGGLTWHDDYLGGNTGEFFLTIECPSSNVCYIGSAQGYVLKNENADLGTSIKSITANHNSQLVLYPNPVTSTTTIEYQTTTAGRAIVTIQNCLGQVAQTLQLTANQKQSINMSSYVSGMYFIKCFDGKEQMVVKVVKE